MTEDQVLKGKVIVSFIEHEREKKINIDDYFHGETWDSKIDLITDALFNFDETSQDRIDGTLRSLIATINLVADEKIHQLQKELEAL